MQAVKFTLCGENAFFKKPEVNSYYYFTYGQIHKVALLGMFGAILGYGGYAQKVWKNSKETLIEEYPEFYERLQDIEIAVVPKNKKGYIPKKIQIYNNSVGYASAEQGGNLIVKEQWLERPVWTIYVKLNHIEAQNIAAYLRENKCVYMPYLGKNDHPATIKNVEIVELLEVDGKEIQLSSLFPKKQSVFWEDDEEEMDVFKYEEMLPVGLNAYTNLYELESFCYTNLFLDIEGNTVYKAGDKNIVFF